MKERIPAKIVPGARIEAAPGLFVWRPLPTKGLQQFSPFLLLDHMGPEQLAPGQKITVPRYPHRGFMPITLLFSGQVEYKDAAGTHAVLSKGDVGWMTAGSGIAHAERMGNPSDAAPGLFHAVQLWVNLPARLKLLEPLFQIIKAESIPCWQQQGALLRIIAGHYGELTGPAPMHTPILLAHGSLKAGATAFIAIPESFALAVYVLEGSLITADGSALDEGELVLWQQEGRGITLSAEQESKFLVLAGEPIQEPLATYGTFVMNRPEELLQAIEDYKAGRMGKMH